MNNIISKCKPSDVRKNLGNTKNQIEKLQEKINALDANSVIINEVSKEGRRGLSDKMFSIYVTINDDSKQHKNIQRKAEMWSMTRSYRKFIVFRSPASSSANAVWDRGLLK